MATLVIEEGKEPAEYNEKKPLKNKDLESIMEETIETAKNHLAEFDYTNAKEVVDSYRWNYSSNMHDNYQTENTKVQIMDSHLRLLWAKANIGIVDEYKNEILTNPEQCSGELTELCTQAALKIEDVERTVDTVGQYLLELKPQNTEEEIYLCKLRIENKNLNTCVKKNQEIYNHVLPYVADKISKHEEQQSSLKYH